MAYLTLEEFQSKTHIDLTPEEFEEYLERSSDLLDYLTSYFYVANDMTLVNPWVNAQFKKALVAQIEYFNEVGSTTFESMNNKPQSFSAGRTSVSQTLRNSNQQASKELVAEEVYIYLSGTGLLFGGVNTL